MSSEKMNDMLDSWPVLDLLDFETVVADVTKWSDDHYTLMFNFYLPNETGEPPHKGMSLCTQVGGSTLGEVYEKIVVLVECGMFDHVDVSANGTIFSEEGDEIGEVNWMIYSTEDFEFPDSAFKVTGSGTLQ